ncbi:MAG TPA: hypothetical protein VMT32_11645 [Bryobacteraceae bacterium]|nr:hypothetical protein [Bryobacteraceae bacterium]
MSISNISFGNTPANIQNWQAMAGQRRQDLQSLASSLKSGDLGGAQQAYSDLQTLASANPSSTSSISPVQQDFTALGKDLSAGNLSQAQKDFAQMKTDFQSALGQNGASTGVHHHHGRHVHKAAATPSDETTPGASPTLFSPYASASATDNSMASSLFSLMG